MCGRISRTSEALADEFSVARFVNVDLRPRYNVAPSENIQTIIRVGDEKRLGPMRWGFVPTAAKDPKLAPINARAETLATSPMFRDAFRRHRCLVVVDGFYEWRKDGRTKTSYFVRLRSGRPFGFAGIWSLRRDESWEPLRDLRNSDLPAEPAHGHDPQSHAGDPTSGCARSVARPDGGRG